MVVSWISFDRLRHNVITGWVEKRYDMALNSGVFVDSLTPQGPAKKIPGLCPGMKLLRAQVGQGPEKDVSGHTRATVQHLWTEAKNRQVHKAVCSSLCVFQAFHERLLVVPVR